MRHAYAMLLLLGPLVGPALAQGAPRSVGDCERIRGDLAYNQCLSLFGPAAPIKAATGASAPAIATTGTTARLPEALAVPEAVAPSYRGRRRFGAQVRLGRQRASFTAISGGGSRRHRRR